MKRSYPLFVATAFSMALAAGCASSNRPAPEEEAPPPPRAASESKASRAEAPARPAPAAKKGTAAAPATGKLSQVKVGMGEVEVRDVMGPPDNEQTYTTGKQFIPGYVGSDTERTEWIYRGEGRVVLVRNRWSGKLKVTRVLPDPNQ
ncbi:MAG TPA: hypothetical protein VEC57_00900 [Candidatus Limnocylindrales bacterium]|nr:hypothetical protein [Candidatus Limnocylindrales bacterium]